MSFCERLQELDADEVFAYNTVKLVRVKDRYLGFVRYGSMLGIFLYIIVWVLIMQKKYLQLETPIGSVGATLMGPYGEVSFKDYSFCKGYVPNPAKPQPHYYVQEQCEVWDNYGARFPADQFNAVVVSTRITYAVQPRMCFFPKDKSCAFPFGRGDKTSVYLAGVDDYTVSVQHNMQAQKFYRETGNSKFARASSDMTGKMVASNGSVYKYFQENSRDIASVNDFVTAAGISLADWSVAIGANLTAHEPLRYGGQLIFVVISYDNVATATPYSEDAPSYTWYVSAVPGAENKVVEEIYLNETHRMIRDRHGVKLVFIVAGSIGRFNFQVMLIQLVSALGLLSVATLVVELMMLYILPHRKMYNEYKFEETVDFSDVRDAEDAGISDEAFNAQLQGDLAEMRGIAMDGPLSSQHRSSGGHYSSLS